MDSCCKEVGIVVNLIEIMNFLSLTSACKNDYALHYKMDFIIVLIFLLKHYYNFTCMVKINKLKNNVIIVLFYLIFSYAT